MGIDLLAGGPTTCDACGKRFTNGGRVSIDSTPFLDLCRWCIALWLETITDYRVFDQLLDWETKHTNRKRYNKWNGWTPKPPREPWAGIIEEDIPCGHQFCTIDQCVSKATEQ